MDKDEQPAPIPSLQSSSIHESATMYGNELYITYIFNSNLKGPLKSSNNTIINAAMDKFKHLYLSDN